MKKLLFVLFLICPSFVMGENIELVKGEFSCQVTNTVNTMYDGSSVSEIPSGLLDIEVGDVLTVSYSVGMGYLLKTELLKGDDKLVDLSGVDGEGKYYRGYENDLFITNEFGHTQISKSIDYWYYYTSDIITGIEITLQGPVLVTGILRNTDYLCDGKRDQDFPCSQTVFMKCDHTVDRLKELLSVSTMVFEEYE